LINNRQGGRRRGRGGQRGQNLGGQPGNRQDNRQRGNAAQLLEKYKNMARDAQLSGDRVQTEYYLQFADHYFRVLSENRARFEEQNPRRSRDDEYDGDDGDEEMVEAGEEQEAEADDRRDRPERSDRSERYNRRDREPRRRDRDEQSADEAGERDREREPRRPRVNGNGAETIPFDVLPPAIGRDDDGEEAEASEKPARRPRTRRARPADDGEVAPAA
jgi:hypothetical protein